MKDDGLAVKDGLATKDNGLAMKDILHHKGQHGHETWPGREGQQPGHKGQAGHER